MYEPEENPLTPGNISASSGDGSTQDSFESIAKSAQEFNLALDNLKMVCWSHWGSCLLFLFVFQVFSVEVFRGLLGFATWWCCFVYFATTSVGLVYQSYFSIS